MNKPVVFETEVTEIIRKAVKYPNERVDPYLIEQIMQAFNAALLAELQTLASSNNWRVQLESRIAQLTPPEGGDE